MKHFLGSGRPLLNERLFALDERHIEAVVHGLTGSTPHAGWADPDEDQPKPYEQDGPVAIVSINGPLSQRGGWWCDGYESILRRGTAALTDSSVNSLVLRISSPGGVVVGLFETVRSLRAAAVIAGKPVVAYCDELAASAAYALACVADQIVLPASGEAGSVGVIAVPMSIARMLDEIGIDARIVKSGAKKADLHPAAPLSDAAIARLQADVDELASQFAGLVGERRGMSPDAVLALEAGVFMGQAAVAAGLADSVGNLADAKAAALAMAQISSGDSRRRMSAKAETKRAERPEGHRSMESIAKALGLKADATEGEILVAITEQRALLTGFISLAGATSPSEATGVFRGWQEGTRRAEALAAQLAETTKAREAEEARTLLDAAISDGRLAPAAREEFAKLALPTLRGLLAALPRTGPVASGAMPPTRAGGAVLTDEDREICKQTGVSEEAFAKTKARRTGLGG